MNDLKSKTIIGMYFVTDEGEKVKIDAKTVLAFTFSADDDVYKGKPGDMSGSVTHIGRVLPDHCATKVFPHLLKVYATSAAKQKNENEIDAAYFMKCIGDRMIEEARDMVKNAWPRTSGTDENPEKLARDVFRLMQIGRPQEDK